MLRLSARQPPARRSSAVQHVPLFHHTFLSLPAALLGRPAGGSFLMSPESPAASGGILAATGSAAGGEAEGGGASPTVGGGAGEEGPGGKGFTMRSERFRGVYRMPTGR